MVSKLVEPLVDCAAAAADESCGGQGGQAGVAGAGADVRGRADVVRVGEAAVDDEFVDAAVLVADDFPGGVHVFNAGCGQSCVVEWCGVLPGEGVEVGVAALRGAGADQRSAGPIADGRAGSPRQWSR